MKYTSYETTSGLKQIIKQARESSPQDGQTLCFGVTRGQIISFSERMQNLQIHYCWFEICAKQESDQQYIILQPLLSQRQIEWQIIGTPILTEQFEALITDERCEFGGESIEFKEPYDPNGNDYEKRILTDWAFSVDEQLRTSTNVKQRYEKTLQRIYEDNFGNLIIRSRDEYFRLVHETTAYTNQYNCYMREYKGVAPWKHLMNPRTKDFHDTANAKQLVPTLWIPENPEKYEFYLDFLASWRIKNSTTITAAVGAFVYTHKLSYGRIITKTSLRISDSVAHQN